LMTLPDDAVLKRIAAAADDADQSVEWPSTSWNALRDVGVLGWSIPAEYGGLGLKSVDLLAGQQRIATACLTTAFILSQREAAVRHLLRGPVPLKERLLPPLARGEEFTTVGLSQLTTSRQHGGPALRATPTASGFRLDGDIPWVTGADQAHVVVVGATLEDGKQILVALPTNLPGVTTDSSLPLASLVGSRTAAMHCSNVLAEQELILAGPLERVLGLVGGGGLETSNLALGLAVAATELLEREADKREDVVLIAHRFRKAAEAANVRLHASAIAPVSETTMSVRVECTRLALRATQTLLLISKGAGFMTPHPAQRLARQALFFLVWSCPRPVASGVLEDLLPNE
jgi:butyryl-CoA dehydrogenase